MAVRVNATEVLAIMDNCPLEENEIDPYIVASSTIVDKVFEDDTVMTTALLKEVEKWFAAHLIAVTKHRTVDNETVGDVTVKYTGKYGFGLNSTPYGQTVKMFDITGKFASYIGKKQASIYAVISFDE